MRDLEALYEEYHDKLYAFCLTLTRNSDEAEELAAETFCRAIASYGKFRGESSVGTWLCSIARNKYLSDQRKKKRKPLYEPPPDSFDALDDRDDVKRILIAMNKLEEPYRGVFTYRVIGKMDSAEIGRLYGKTANWAYVTYSRAKLKIIQMLEEI